MPLPPRFLRWLAKLLAPGEKGEFLRGDLDELYDRHARSSPGSARRWYARELLLLASTWWWRSTTTRIQGLMRGRIRLSHQRPGDGMIRILLRNIRYALRDIRRQPGFAASVIMTLAIGIGASSSIYSVAHSVLLRPLPYEDPDELVLVRIDVGDAKGYPAIAGVTADAFRRRSRLLDGLGVSGRESAAEIEIDGTVEMVMTAPVTQNLFPLLGVRPILGRNFSPREAQAGRQSAVILSHRFWRSRYGEDPSIIGQSMQVNGEAVPVVGVMPSSSAVRRRRGARALRSRDSRRSRVPRPMPDSVR